MTPNNLRPDGIYVVGLGAQTPVGRSYLSAAAAVHGKISRYTEHPYMLDRHGEAMIVARAGWLDVALPLEGRLTVLASDAAREALQPLRDGSGVKLHIHLALAAELGAGAANRVADVFANAVGAFVIDDLGLATMGHAGGYVALERAIAELRHGEPSACLVGGVDSYLDADLLEALDTAERLRSSRTKWGFTPGEAAGFCLLVRGATAAALGLAPLAEIEAVATAQEEILLGTPGVNLGAGLSSVIHQVVDTRNCIHYTYCDLNGETYRADEFAFVVARTPERFVDVAGFTAAAECWGDVGAASGPLAWALAAAAWARGYARGPVALAWASSGHAPPRGAARLRCPRRM